MLAAHQPDEAARLLTEALGSAVSCVTNQRLSVSTSRVVPNETYALRLSERPPSLRASWGGPSGLRFDVEQHFVVVGARVERDDLIWLAATTMYQYRLLDHNEKELLVYHWQPGDAFLGPDYPHLHVSAALNAQTSAIDRQSIDLDKLHLPSGRVSLASVVRMLITEFHVAPRRHDCVEALDRGERVFQDDAGQIA